MTDAVICAMPHCDEPLMTLWFAGNLKACLVREGIDAVSMDLNAEIMSSVAGTDIQDTVMDFFYHQKCEEDSVPVVTEVVERMINRATEHEAKNIFIFLENYAGQIISKWVCAGIRQRLPDSKIVIMGNGVRKELGTANLSFIEEMQDLSLIDDFILGDLEEAVVAYMKGEDHPNINKRDWKSIDDFEGLPPPDFTDMDLDLYDIKRIPMVDSRSCIKGCQFCNIPDYYKKFQTRPGDRLFQEMLHQVETIGRRDFEFVTKISNGNQKEFKRLLTLIAEYNSDKSRDQQISWYGHFMIREQQHHSEDLFQLLKASNAELLIGVEGVVEKTRMSMQKGSFTNADLDYHLDMCRKYGIENTMRAPLAWPNETLQDFADSIQWFKDRKHYANSPLKRMEFALIGIWEGTPLARRSEEFNLKTTKYPSIYMNQNLGITPKQRKEFLLSVYKVTTEEWGVETVLNQQELWSIDNVEL